MSKPPAFCRKKLKFLDIDIPTGSVKGFSVDLRLYSTRKAMIKALGDESPKTTGMFRGYMKEKWNGKEYKLTDEIGAIYINREDICMDILSHECGHGAITYARRHNIDPLKLEDGQYEIHENEVFCDVLGRMVSCVTAWVIYWGVDIQAYRTD